MFGNTDNNLKAVQKSYEFIKFKWQGSGDIHNHFFSSPEIWYLHYSRLE